MRTPEKHPVASFIPWDDAMALGLGVLRLSPATFWAMTPRELRAAANGIYGRHTGEPLNRAALDDLMTQFPDGNDGQTA